MIHAPAKRVTLKDIAREAGVATGTVSMVLNDSPRVANTTRSHVQHLSLIHISEPTRPY